MTDAVAPDAERIRALTVVARPPLVPELRLHLTTPDCPLWHASPDTLASFGVFDPYWAFCWGGGQAMARLLLDRPELVRGRRVLDVGAGGGVEAIAAARAGAARVRAVDIDPWATETVRLNAALNAVEVEAATGDPLAAPPGDWEVFLAADLTYDPHIARRLLDWLAAPVAAGATALLGDLDRGFLPEDSELERLVHRDAPADNDVAGRHLRPASVYRLSHTGEEGS